MRLIRLKKTFNFTFYKQVTLDTAHIYENKSYSLESLPLVRSYQNHTSISGYLYLCRSCTVDFCQQYHDRDTFQRIFLGFVAIQQYQRRKDMVYLPHSYRIN